MSSTQCAYVPVEHFQVIVKKLYTSSGIPSYYHTVEITYIQVFTGVHTIHTCIHILEQQGDYGEQQRTNFSVSVTVVIDTLCSFVSFSGIFSYTFSENTPTYMQTQHHTYIYVRISDNKNIPFCFSTSHTTADPSVVTVNARVDAGI